MKKFLEMLFEVLVFTFLVMPVGIIICCLMCVAIILIAPFYMISKTIDYILINI